MKHFFNEMRFDERGSRPLIMPDPAMLPIELSLRGPLVQTRVIRKGYDEDCDYEKPAFQSPQATTQDNFYEHLGDEKYYYAYMQFLTQFIKERDIPADLEEFIFFHKANVGPSANLPLEKQTQVLHRFLSSSPASHNPCGLGDRVQPPGMVVEAIAQTAMHHSSPCLLASLSLFDGERLTGHDARASLARTFSAALPGFGFAFSTIPPHSATVTQLADSGPHAPTILSRVLADPKFASPGSVEIDETKIYDASVETHAGRAGQEDGGGRLGRLRPVWCCWMLGYEARRKRGQRDEI